LRLGQEVDLLGDDLAAVATLAGAIGPEGVVVPSGDHDHRAFDDVLCDALSDAIEARDPVPLGLGLTGPIMRAIHDKVIAPHMAGVLRTQPHA